MQIADTAHRGREILSCVRAGGVYVIEDPHICGSCSYAKECDENKERPYADTIIFGFSGRTELSPAMYFHDGRFETFTEDQFEQEVGGATLEKELQPDDGKGETE